MMDPLGHLASRRFTLWQQAAALAPALLLLVYLPAQVMMRCRMDGLLRSACCCPQQSEEPSPGPVVKAQDCCDQHVAAGERPKADVARSSSRGLAPSAALAVVVPAVPPLVPATHRFDRAVQRYGPAREGPPLVLLKHAFLI
jgi:hypothetical protein